MTDIAPATDIDARLHALEEAANSWAALLGEDVRTMIAELKQIHSGTSSWAAAVGEDIRILTREVAELRGRVAELEA